MEYVCDGGDMECVVEGDMEYVCVMQRDTWALWGGHMGYVNGGDGGGNESYSKCAASTCVFLSCPGSALCQAPVFSFTIQKAQQFIWFPLD